MGGDVDIADYYKTEQCDNDDGLNSGPEQWLFAYACWNNTVSSANSEASVAQFMHQAPEHSLAFQAPGDTLACASPIDSHGAPQPLSCVQEAAPCFEIRCTKFAT